MKNKYLYIIFIISLLTSCFQDKGNYNYTEHEEITVTGIESSYTKISLVDRITLDPTITSNKPGAEFKYWWGIYETSVQGSVPKVDTLYRTKSIDYLVDKSAKTWVLVFGAKNIKTGYTKIITSNINVVTQFTRGWYVAKTENGKTDMDLFLTPTNIIPEGKMENVFSLVNGEKLEGQAMSLRFYHDYKAFNGSLFANTRSLFLVSDGDASVVDIGTLKVIRDFNALFYGVPSVKKPDFVCNGSSAFYFANNGNLHSIYNMSANSGQFGAPQMVDEYNSPYKLSKYYFTYWVYDPIFFNETTTSFVSAGGAGTQLVAVRDAATTNMPANNTNKKLLYMGHKTGSQAVAVLQDKTDPNLKIVSKITPSTSAMMIVNDTLSANEKVFNATLYTLFNADEDMMYFTVGKEVWSRNLTNRFEQLQYTVPSDETITYIHHLKYTGEAATYGHNLFAVATKKGDSYIVRMFTKTSGNLDLTPVFTMTGKGEVGDIIYISPSVSGTTYPNTL